MQNVIHITNELSFKNYSITSIILFLKKNFQKTKIVNKVIVGAVDRKILKNNKITILKTNYRNFFSYFHYLKSLKQSLIFLHGIWGPIQIMTILISLMLRKKILIHPHGMFLKEAIEGSNLHKRFFKKLYLSTIKFFINKNVFFVSSTDQEIKQIKYFFPESKYFKIWNPYPSTIYKIKRSNKKNKNFVFFGRINTHKNIFLLIEAFLAAKLGKDWKLKIYGIRDDKKLEGKILKYLKNRKNIQLLKPVYNKKKINILNTSWANILVSKSEILSLSVLEAFVYGLPSLISKNFNFEINDKLVLKCNNNVNEISKKLVEISKWSYQYRKKFEKKILNKFNIKIHNKKIVKKYLNIIRNIDKKIEINK